MAETYPQVRPSPLPGRPEQTNLADILERVLDKGIVIAGDIQINLLDIELLTIKLRLIVASVDRAKEMGIDWWERDPTLSSGHSELEQENRRLRERLEALEGRNGQAALEGDDEPDDVEAGDDDELVDAEIVDDTEEPEPEPQPARRPKQTARQGGGGKAAPRRRRKAEE